MPIIGGVADLRNFIPGEVLVAGSTGRDWESVLKTVGAIVADHDGRTCHAAIVARELGVPAVVGAGNATGTLHAGQTVTVACAGGEVGTVHEGALPFTVTRVPQSALPLLRTRSAAAGGAGDGARSRHVLAGARDRQSVLWRVRGVQFQEPLFVCPDACAGSGEAPYLRLPSQLFGDRMLVANASGYSTIQGHMIRQAATRTRGVGHARPGGHPRRDDQVNLDR